MVNVSINGQIHELHEPTTLAGLLEQLELNPRRIAVEVNGQLAPRGEHSRTLLSANDSIEIVTLAGGG